MHNGSYSPESWQYIKYCIQHPANCPTLHDYQWRRSKGGAEINCPPQKLSENLLLIGKFSPKMLNLKLITRNLKKLRGKIKILSPIISSVGNLRLSVEILSENGNFLLCRLFLTHDAAVDHLVWVTDASLAWAHHILRRPISEWKKTSQLLQWYLDGVEAADDSSVLHVDVWRWMRVAAVRLRPSTSLTRVLPAHLQRQPARVLPRRRHPTQQHWRSRRRPAPSLPRRRRRRWRHQSHRWRHFRCCWCFERRLNDRPSTDRRTINESVDKSINVFKRNANDNDYVSWAVTLLRKHKSTAKYERCSKSSHCPTQWSHFVTSIFQHNLLRTKMYMCCAWFGVSPKLEIPL